MEIEIRNNPETEGGFKLRAMVSPFMDQMKEADASLVGIAALPEDGEKGAPVVVMLNATPDVAGKLLADLVQNIEANLPKSAAVMFLLEFQDRLRLNLMEAIKGGARNEVERYS